MQQQRLSRYHGEDDDYLLSYEMEQSFVGTKTIGGFTLQEDDDDVYNDNVNKASKINHDEYDTVVYEQASDAEDEDTIRNAEMGEEFGSVVASWATSKCGDQRPSSAGITSDGRPPLPGFVLGASSSSKMSQRYPGPDIPSGYEPKCHKFGKDENPGTWKDESRTSQEERMEEQRKIIQAERRAGMLKKEKECESGPMAGSAFAGLAVAMKDHFTSSMRDTSEIDDECKAIGLHQPNMNGVLLPPEPNTVQNTTQSTTALGCLR
jgi:hypothetical protein